MASVDIVGCKHVLEDQAFLPRKRFKTSELPINATQRSTIDGLLHTIKKKGEYDLLRKKVWSEFEKSAEKTAFTNQLNELAEAEIERDPSLLSRDRGKAATLMSGVVDRSDIYKSVETTLDALIAKNINHILQAGREIRRAEVGEEIAATEEKKGNRTDEEYAKDAAKRREERARERKREEARKRREEEKDRLRAEEAKHMKEIEKLQNQNERRKEREAARAERERLAEERRRRDRPKENPEADKEKDKAKVKVEDKDKAKVEDSDMVPTTPVAPPMDNKALEEAALALLLQEGRELAAKNGPPKPEPELSDSEVPHRKPHVSPPKGPAADRNKTLGKPRLSYSSTPLHQGSGTPVPTYQSGGAPDSRSPYRAPSARHDRSRSPDHPHRLSHSYSYRDDDARAQADLEHKAIYKAQMQAKRDSEAEAFKRRGRSERDEGEYRSRSPSRDKDRERSKRNDHYDYSREQSRHPDERPRSRDRERERPRYEEREKTYTRPRREEAPEHIDRYVPGGAAPAREKRRSTLDAGAERDDKDRHVREETRDRDASTRERDSTYRDSKRDYRERSSYHESHRHRDRDDYDRDRYRDREHHRDHRDRDRDRDRDRGDEKSRGYERERERERDGREERPYVRPRREPVPENIDRYVPGAG